MATIKNKRRSRQLIAPLDGQATVPRGLVGEVTHSTVSIAKLKAN